LVTIRALSNVGNYAYYLEKEGQGEWLGEGAKELGLEGRVNPADFNRVRLGEHPSTGEKLRPIQMPDRVYKTKYGERTHYAREAYDVVISAPKSVSVQALFDPRLADAHRGSVIAATKEMEALAGNLVIAAYQHKNSRALDPQIHTHLLTANLEKSERWRAVSAANFYKNTEYLDSVYRHNLFTHAERLGYRVKDGELEHVSQGLMEKFSVRTKHRDEAIQRHMTERGMTEYPSDNEIAKLVYKNRPKKDPNLTEDQIRISQFQRFTPEEKQTLRTAREESKQHVREMKEHPQERVAQHRGVHLKIAYGEETGETHHLTYGERIRL
jgi:conjugative relaxase-like TrwC/TraI family protein